MNDYRAIETAWLLLFIVLIAAGVFALVGCAPVQCVKPVITLQRPVLPTVSAERLQCLDDQTYLDLVSRELSLREYAEQCEAIVQEMTQ